MFAKKSLKAKYTYCEQSTSYRHVHLSIIYLIIEIFVQTIFDHATNQWEFIWGY